jgi:hypothetical protein
MTQQAQENFGLAAEQERAGYTPMQPAFPVDAPSEAPEFDTREAANQLAERREQEQRESRPIDITREYQEMGGEHAGRPKPITEVVSKEQAAADLALARQGEVETQATLEDLELQRTIDALRSGDPQPIEPTQAQQPAQQPVEQPQPEAEYKVAEIGDIEIQRALEANPRLLEAIRSYDFQTSQKIEAAQNQAFAAAAAHKQQFEAGLANNALLAASVLFHDTPEISASGDPVAALRMIQAQNPERARAIAGRIAQVQNLVQQYTQQEQQNRAAYQQAAQAQFQEYGKRSDDIVDKQSRAELGDAEYQRVRGAAPQVLRDHYGISEADQARLWQSDSTFRSAAGQSLIRDAVRWRLSQQSIKEKVHRVVPTVQPPSSPAARGSEQDYSMRQLEKRLAETGSPKDAAALLLARRNARR